MRRLPIAPRFAFALLGIALLATGGCVSAPRLLTSTTTVNLGPGGTAVLTLEVWGEAPGRLRLNNAGPGSVSVLVIDEDGAEVARQSIGRLDHAILPDDPACCRVVLEATGTRAAKVTVGVVSSDGVRVESDLDAAPGPRAETTDG